jgi:hypothetical protein
MKHALLAIAPFLLPVAAFFTLFAPLSAAYFSGQVAFCSVFLVAAAASIIWRIASKPDFGVWDFLLAVAAFGWLSIVVVLSAILVLNIRM